MDPTMLLQLLGGSQNNFGRAGAAGSLLGMGMGKGDDKLKFGQDGMATKGETMNMAIGQGLTTALSTASNFGAINNSNMSLGQKQMMRADAGVNAVADTASMFGPVGSTIGAGLKAINTVGGMLIKTPDAVKNFAVNEQIATSSGFGGVTSQANDVTATADTFGTSGLAGKLTGKKKLLSSIGNSNMMQSKVSGVLDASKLAQNSAVASADMFSAKNQSKLYNTSTWNNGSVMMGSQGGTLTTSGSNETKTVSSNYSKLGKAAKSLNLKKITSNIKKNQEGGKVDKDEADFLKWYSKVAKHKQLDPNPDAKEHFYDYRTFYTKEKALAEKLLTDDPSAHFTDIGKLPGHPTFSNESAFFNEKNKNQAGWWSGDVYIPFDQKKPSLDTVTGSEIPPLVKYNDIVKKHKDGGVMNVIVDGALHAHKHTLKDNEHLEDADITLKGIPVVSHAEGGEVTQHAEVERDELILHYDLTKKLEDLYEEGDLEAMIQAGRILSKEIVKNTKDSKSKIIKNAE